MKPRIEMTIDPSEYDLGELHSAPGNGFVYPDEEPVGEPAGDVLRAGHYRELLLLQSGSAGPDLEKPYLASMPSTYEGEVAVFEWLEFLADKGGFKRTYDALRHYRSLGWITEPVETRLRDYLAGVPEPDSDETQPFDQSDHLLSLIYIGRLASA